jgi:hypothetical protein
MTSRASAAATASTPRTPGPASAAAGCSATPRSPGRQLRDFNRAAIDDGREPFEGSAMEFLGALRELEEG